MDFTEISKVSYKNHKCLRILNNKINYSFIRILILSTTIFHKYVDKKPNYTDYIYAQTLTFKTGVANCNLN